MIEDKRTGGNAVPANLDELLNERQKRTLRETEGFGWRLKFVRRPLFQGPVFVVCNVGGEKIGTLEKDGSINFEPDIKVRDRTQNYLSWFKYQKADNNKENTV